jgi:major membrane immunogen (membrane-anchored lipoprotein)
MKRLSVIMIVVFVLSALLTACGGGAASDPVGVVKEAMQAVADKKFDKLAELTCAAKKADVENIFNPAGALAGAGIDAQKMLDAMTISIQDAQYTKVSESGDKAEVQMKAKMSIKVDKEKFKAVMVDLLKAQGQEVPADQIDPILDMAVGQVEQSQDVDNKIDVVKENGKWVICPN